MINLTTFKSTPFGSIITRDAVEQDRLHELFFSLPPGMKRMATSDKTGMTIRTVAGRYGLQSSLVPVASFCVFRVLLGEVPFAQLSGILSTELKLSHEVAEKMSRDMEKELFAPISFELNQYLAKKRQSQKSISHKKPNVQNVLNLKEQKQQPKPPVIPR